MRKCKVSHMRAPLGNSRCSSAGGPSYCHGAHCDLVVLLFPEARHNFIRLKAPTRLFGVNACSR